MPNNFKLCPTHISRGVEKFCRGIRPRALPGYEPVSIINTGKARVRERHECISEALVTYVQVPFTIKGSLH